MFATVISTFSLHDALPILRKKARRLLRIIPAPVPLFFVARSVFHLKRGTLLRPTLPTIIQSGRGNIGVPQPLLHFRSEEHTSELQSHSDLVCRLLLEKKNN